MSDIEIAKEKLQSEGHSVVLVKDGIILLDDTRGILPVVKLYESGNDYTGYAIADRIVGKAAALLYCKIQPKELFAGVITETALTLLQNAGVPIAYSVLCQHIIDRTGKDLCPMEKAVQNVNSPKDAYLAIHRKMIELKKHTESKELKV